MPPTPPRQELDLSTLERCRAHDPVAFRAFVVRYQGAVFAVLARILGRVPELEDLAQDSFLKAYQALPRFDPGGSAKVSTWLLTIATRVALDAAKRKHVPIQALDAAVEVAGGESPEQLRERRTLGNALSDAALQLSEEQRAAFVLWHFHGFTLEEMVNALGCPAATVKTRLFRARQRLREILEPQLAEGSGQ
jgi:RNA polymerase sigma-70 factor (ECF subfamily)